jgi:hypothetical protein
MGVIRVDDKLQKEIVSLIKKKDLKYKYPTLSAFVNRAIYEKILKINGEPIKGEENE